MSWVDWLIVLIPVAGVYWIGWYSRRYIRSVSDYLAASRLCGRYVINVGDLANALSIIGLTAYVEVSYKTGFALSYWNILVNQMWIILSLTGFCLYRFRETKAMSVGQFFEMRYSRPFRIFAATLRTVSEILANMIMPALAARFFIYFLDLPQEFAVFGITMSTFKAIIVLTLVMALTIICMGGTLALVITDTIQGMVCYPLLFLFVIFVLCRFSWSGEILPVMIDRVAGESFINPYDIQNLQDFNAFSMIFLVIFNGILHRASWMGGGSSSAARSPHEQKMGILLGAWRNTLMSVFYLLIAVTVIVLLNHVHFADQAHAVRTEVASRAVKEIVTDPQVQKAVLTDVAAVPAERHRIGTDAPLSQKSNPDTRYLDVMHASLKDNLTDEGRANSLFQQCRTLFYQLSMAVSMRHMLPVGLMGLFCLLMIMAMVSTDDSRIYASSLTIAQDVVLPLIKKPLTPRQHIRLIRLSALLVGVIFFFGSGYMSQLDYINIYVTLVCTMWLGGCGPVMIFGLYGRFGTTAGAWTSLIVGMVMAVLGVVMQQQWAPVIYPWLLQHGMTESVDAVLRACSAPFEPWIVWRMDPVRIPINSYEFSFLTMLLTLILYVVVSLLTLKEPFNLDRMLHRGKYALDGERNISMKWNWRSVFSNLIGITPEYTKGDRVIAWAVFWHSFGYSLVGCFLLMAVWNLISPVPNSAWGKYFLIVELVVPGIISLITMFWFGIGSVLDLRRLFHDLRARVVNPLDDGRVEGNMSLADKRELEALDAPEKKENGR